MKPLQQAYRDDMLPQLVKDLKLANAMAAPRLQKVVLNVGITGEQHQKQALDNMADQLAAITGQKPKVTQARQSIAGFKLREGDPVGLAVTLRGARMYSFVEKLINIVLPRVKDFQGVSLTAFDQSGNYSLGLEEQIIFPEIDYDKIDKIRGLQVNFVIDSENKDHAFALLKMMGMPFKKEQS